MKTQSSVEYIIDGISDKHPTVDRSSISKVITALYKVRKEIWELDKELFEVINTKGGRKYISYEVSISRISELSTKLVTKLLERNILSKEAVDLLK
jgi:hypothetical protein